MSFIGIVTQKEQDTGVTLEAKVVSPNKKKYAKKRFKVKVKANALDDFTCCVLDHATQVNRLNVYNEMDKIKQDITASMGYNGEHGTTISYAVIDIEAPKLSECLTESGSIIKRPKVGEGDAVGYLEVIVTKNEARVSSRVQIVIPALEEDEVLNQMSLSSEYLWNLIRGGNNVWSSNGYRNIASQLQFDKAKEIKPDNITSIGKKLAAMSNSPITIEWSVEDKSLDFAVSKELYDKERIDVTDGSIIRPKYTDAYKFVGQAGTNITIEAIDDTTPNVVLNTGVKYIRISGIMLTATAKLGKASKQFSIDCATTSLYLTNKEILELLIGEKPSDCQFILTRPNGSEIKYSSAMNEYEIIAKAGEETYELTSYRNAQKFSIPSLNMDYVEGVNIINSVKDHTGAGEYPHLYAFEGNGFADLENGYQSSLTLLFNEFKNIDTTEDPDAKTFVCRADIAVIGYSYDGLNTGGTAENMTLYVKLKVNTSALETE